MIKFTYKANTCDNNTKFKERVIMMKRFISFLTSLAMVFSLLVYMPKTKSKALSSKIENALQWANTIAQNDEHWYGRCGNNDGPHYDCSSLVFWALRHSGFELNLPVFYTGNMIERLTPYGFTWIPWYQLGGYGNLQRGDILLYDNRAADYGHTEMYLGNGKSISADGDDYGIIVRDVWHIETYIYGEPWDGVLRYTGEDNDNTKPIIDDITISDRSSEGYLIKCRVTDNVGIARVSFPTWTLKKDENGNDQDDLIWRDGDRDGDIFSFRVNISEHSGETEQYLTHIYAYDLSGNWTSIAVDVQDVINDTIKPTITDVFVSNISASGYTVNCSINDEGGSGISRVQFPTWTVNNDQDDIQQTRAILTLFNNILQLQTFLRHCLYYRIRISLMSTVTVK